MMRSCFALLLFFTVPLSAQVTDVLFIGNSYTGVNNLPDMVAQLALASGDTINWDASTPGGYTLQLHSQDANTLSKINQRPWDFVVIQAQSQEPSLDTPYVQANVFPYARLLDSLIQVNDSCTQTVFYMTWGRKFGDASNCSAYPPVCTYSGMQDQLKGRYLQMATDNNAVVAPAGAAWQNTIAGNPAFDLYQADQSHPSVHGTYLTACVFYATIFRQSPVGLTYYGGLPANEAALLQNIAASTVLDSMQLWRTETYYPAASFTVSTSANSATCTADSSGIVSFLWSDGNTPGFFPGGATATFTYGTPGTYTICLEVSNGCLTDTICQNVNVGPAAVSEAVPGTFEVSYDASQHAIFFSGDSEVFAGLVSMNGQIVRSSKFPGGRNVMPLGDLPAGVYCFRAETAGTVYSKTIVITK